MTHKASTWDQSLIHSGLINQYLGVGNVHVHPRFHPMLVEWNLGLNTKFSISNISANFHSGACNENAMSQKATII